MSRHQHACTAQKSARLLVAFATATLGIESYGYAQETVSAPRDAAAEFDAADFNGNGCVDWEELRNQNMVVFGALDLNSDGTITPDELRQHIQPGTELPKQGSVDLAALQKALYTAFDEEDADDSGCIDRNEWT